jgi:FAD/FMN-containing dehydrogenase
MSYELKTLDDGFATLPDEDVQAWATSLQGEVLEPGDDGYEKTRIVQNGMIDCRPGLIVRCTGAADVMDAVRFAGRHGFLTAVRGGGHSVAGHCTCDQGIMIDLSLMRGVRVDPESRRVRSQGGATWADVDRESQAFGLAVPGGVVSTTGVAGLTLGGGIGWLHRKYGLACDSLVSADVVTPEGERVTASESENEDLFWGLRGGGGNFGVVTSFEFESYPLGPIAMCGAVFYPMNAADDVFPAWRDWSATLPEEVTTRALFWSMPASEVLPPPVHDQDVLIIASLYAGPPEEGERVIQPSRELGEPLVDLSGPMPYRAFQSMLDPLFPRGEVGSYWKSTFLDDLSDDVTDFILEIGQNRPNDYTLIHVPQMGGATSRVDPTATAFGDRSARYMLSLDGNWTDPADEDTVITWIREKFAEAERLAGSEGAYLNFSSDPAERSQDVVTMAFGDNLGRLSRLKGQYDPNNLFRLNSNVAPAPDAGA